MTSDRGNVITSTLAIAALAVAMSSAGCSRDVSEAVDGDVITVRGVDVPLSFEPKEIVLDAGRYEIRFRNEGMLPHQLAVGSPDTDGKYADGDTKEVAGGEKASFTIRLDEGRHAFACYVDRHNEAGMTGTLIVR
jgi:uncharacterized cupredoxin-like copper-binding protein